MRDYLGEILAAEDSDWEPQDPKTCPHSKTYFDEKGEKCRACGTYVRKAGD